MSNTEARIRSFIWGGVSAAVILAFVIVGLVNAFDAMTLIGGIVLAIAAFTLVSCIILGNDFVGDMMLTVFGWGFVKMPGLIFTLDLDGIIWLLTVKLVFFIIGIILAIICGILAILLGLVASIFVYPYAIITNVRG